MELTESQVSVIFGINTNTLKKLIRESSIPYEQTSVGVRFNLDTITEWLKNDPLTRHDEKATLKKIQANLQARFPETFEALHTMDTNFIAHSNAQKNPKLYSFVKILSKKYGFLYYVRYIDNGKLVPSKWNTHTNILEEAEQFAQNNRSRILSTYYSKHIVKGEVYTILETYYEAGSKYLANDEHRNRTIGERTRRVYYHFIRDTFIPFLEQNDITTFAAIDIPLVARFQNQLLEKGLKPQSVNRYMGSIRAIFSQLLMTGVIQDSAFDRIKALRASAKSTAIRGCYDLESLSGIFAAPWEDMLLYLLCLMIYTTGIRNSEIERIKGTDIIELDGIHFIAITKSKTESGIRIVPLHSNLYTHINNYVTQTGKQREDYLFSEQGVPNRSALYRNANSVLGEKLGLSEKQLEEQGISFYSGRHFWKTLMNAGGLGEDIEEFFMGHKVSGDVAKTYNHKDKQGKVKLLEKAREVLAILDATVFKQSKSLV